MNDKNTEVLRRLTALLLCSAVTAGMPCTAGAQQTEQTVYFSAEKQLPDGSELFAGYVDNLFNAKPYSSKLPQPSGRNQLDPITQVFYNELSEKIRLVANGELTDTKFVFDVPYLTKKYGLTDIELTKYNLQSLLNALLTDMPYELYWFDKTTSIKALSSLYRQKFEFDFFVSADYSASGETKTKSTNAKKMSAAMNAKKNALAIVENVPTGWSDYHTLRYFKDKISELVDYDYDSAANVSEVNYGDPWQMIYVFDGDKNTNVVCEGYSKAFKFLCDNYKFNSDIKCDIMTGQMTSINASGGHMWNNVTIGDKVYIADVTNSDSGSIGASEELFIKGVDESGRLYSSNGKFVGVSIQIGRAKVTYVYDNTTFDMFDPSEIDVSLTSPMLHTIEWKDSRGNLLETVEIAADGETPVYSGQTPVSVWQPEVKTVSGNEETIVYKEYSEKEEHTVTYVIPYNDEPYTQTILDGDVITPPTPPQVDGAEFAGWYADEDYTIPFEFGSAMESDSEIYALYVVKIEWCDDIGNVLHTDELPAGSIPNYDGETPVKESDDMYTYTFTGWSPDIMLADKSMTYNAVFDKTPRIYTMTWQNDDGTTLAVSEIPYGDTPSYSGETPTKASTAEYTYTFIGWSPAIGSVVGNAIYTAQFEHTKNKYKVTWANYDGTVILVDDVPYGETPAYTAAIPERPADSDSVYTFSGWDKELTAVTKDCTYTAVYESQKVEPPTPEDPITPVEPTPDDPTKPVEPTPNDPTKPVELTPDDPISTPDVPNETPDSARTCGDINNDGIIDSTDALGILRISVGIDVLSDTEKRYGDTNGDGAIDSGDALTALRFSVGFKDNDRIGSIIN